MNTYDIIIIGAGPGGYETAIEAAKSGQTVCIVEKAQLGGTCLNVGCIPTKCLCRSAELLHEARIAAEFGIQTAQVDFDLPAAIQRKDKVVESLVSGIETLMRTPGITLLRGEARLADTHSRPYTVEVNTPSEKVSIQASNIIIATGSVSNFLPIEGAHAPGVVTSTELLSATTMPPRLCIIGGGVIGMEFASIYNSFGSKVTVIEYFKEILPFFDRDMAKRLRTSLKKRGITFKTGAAVTKIEDTGATKTVHYTEGNTNGSEEADLVLMAVGRAANLGSLNLDEAGIHYTKRGITVATDMQTNIPGIYAIGDINGMMQLAHAATFQGKVALSHILAQNPEATLQPSLHNIHLDICPAVVFTLPELAMVGRTEEQVKEEGIDYAVKKISYRANGKALAMGEGEGTMKILTDQNDHILGAHILGAHAADLIHEITLLMTLGATTTDLKRTIHAHPTLSELFIN